MTLSVVIITYNEEQNIARTLASVQELVRAIGGEIIVVDSGSTDKTRDIAASYGAKVFIEEWKGFAAQKNSAIEKASGDWVLLLDADEELELALQTHIRALYGTDTERPLAKIATKTFRDIDGFWIPRKNLFLGRWIRHGGFYPDQKLRLFRRGKGRVSKRAVHETVEVDGRTTQYGGSLEPTPGFGPFTMYAASRWPALIHHAYPTLEVYLEHMRRYADLGAEMIRHKPRPILLLNRWLNPPLTFVYNYVFRLGFLDGREGFLLHWNHSRYVSWKYAKALELSRSKN